MNIKINLRQKGSLADIAKQQLPFALSKAVNDTMLDVQRDERSVAGVVFTVRRKSWVDRSFKITKFATKGAPLARLEISPPGAPDRADILSKFEATSTKTPRIGNTVAVPVDARRSKADVIIKSQRPSAILAKGKAFIVKGKGGKGVIKQQIGKGKAAVERILYALTPRALVPKRLHFFDTARDATRRNFNRHLQRWLRQAIRTAK